MSILIEIWFLNNDLKFFVSHLDFSLRDVRTYRRNHQTMNFPRFDYQNNQFPVQTTWKFSTNWKSLFSCFHLFFSFDWLLFIWFFFIFFTIFSCSSQIFLKNYFSCVYFTNWSDCGKRRKFLGNHNNHFELFFSIKKKLKWARKNVKLLHHRIDVVRKVNKKWFFMKISHEFFSRYLSTFPHKFTSSGSVTLSFFVFFRSARVCRRMVGHEWKSWNNNNEEVEVLKETRTFHFLLWFSANLCDIDSISNFFDFILLYGN